MVNEDKTPISEEELETAVLILLEKKAGEPTFRRRLEGTNAEAVLRGLEVLIIEYAGEVGLSVGEVIAVLAAQLLGPAMNAAENEEKSG